MNLRCFGLLLVVIFFGLATVASAEITETVSLIYLGSYDADMNGYMFPTVSTDTGHGTTNTTILSPAGTIYQYHQIGLYVAVSGLAADQDVVYTQFNGIPSGAVNVATLVGGYTPNSYLIDPPAMGIPSSNAPANSWDNLNFYDGTAYVVDVRRGTNTDLPPGKTYGDYAAYMEVGENSPFLIGTQMLTCDSYGPFGFHLSANPGCLKVISNNTNGMALDASYESYPTYTFYADSIGIPEPGTIMMLATGLMGLLSYAWHKRK